MNGILANSVSVTMTDGDADGVVSGFVTAERITLSTTPAGTGHSWSLATPTDATIRSDLSASTGTSVTFVPEVAGEYVVVCTVDGPITYTLRCTVVAPAPTFLTGALRFLARTLASITTPLAGSEALYFDSTVSRYRSKKSDGTAREIDAGARTGAFILSGGTATISDTSIGANSVVMLMVATQTSPGFLRVTLNAGVGFTITSSSGTDASMGRYAVVN